MLKESANNGMAKTDLESGDRFTPVSVGENPKIEQLSEEIRELSDEQSRSIAGGRSRYELSDVQLEAFAGGRVTSIVRIIGFEN